MINEVKELGREELQDEILHILFTYLINENNEKDKLIRSLWNERKKKMIEIDELDYKRLIERSTRINKAIEYIENHSYGLEKENYDKINDILDILKGNDKDDRNSNNNDN